PPTPSSSASWPQGRSSSSARRASSSSGPSADPAWPERIAIHWRLTMPFATSRGARIHYTVHGSKGPAVVLLQGLGLSSRFWFDVPERLGDVRRVIAVDNRGTGRS